MITEQDFETRVAEMLSRRSLDIDDVAVAPVQVLTVSSDPSASTSSPRPPRDRIRFMVAALVLVIGGTGAFVASRGNSTEEVVTGSSDDGGSRLVLPDDAWDLPVPSAHLFPADFSLGIDLPVFSADGEASEVIGAYLTDRLEGQSDSFSWKVADTSSDALQALYRWTWTGDPVEGVSPSGWLYLRFKGDSWGIYAATTDGLDMSDLRFTAQGFEGQIVSDTIQSISNRRLILTPPKLVNGVPYESVSTRRGSGEGMSIAGTFGLLEQCADMVQVKASQLDFSEPFPAEHIDGLMRVSVSEHVMLNTRADRLDCKLPTFSDLVDRNSGPDTTEAALDTPQSPISGLGDVPLPLLVVNTDELSPSLELTELRATILTAPNDTAESASAYIQTFRTNADRFEGPMVLIETSSAGIGLGGGLVDGLESFAASGLTFYILQTETRAHVLLVDGPGLVTATVIGANMTLDELATFASRISAPSPGSLAWKVKDGGALVPVFTGSSTPADRSYESANTVGVWTSDQGGSIVLFVETANDGRFEASIVSRMANNAALSGSTEVINGRTFVIAEGPNLASAIWMENDDAVGTLDTTKILGDIPIRELLGDLDEVTQSQWRNRGGSVARSNADDQSTATTQAPITAAVSN